MLHSKSTFKADYYDFEICHTELIFCNCFVICPGKSFPPLQISASARHPVASACENEDETQNDHDNHTVDILLDILHIYVYRGTSISTGCLPDQPGMIHVSFGSSCTLRGPLNEILIFHGEFHKEFHGDAAVTIQMPISSNICLTKNRFATIMANAPPNLMLYDSPDGLNHPPNMLYRKTLGDEVVYVE